jgi:prepilin-type processing-associated H-X9-DG protein
MPRIRFTPIDLLAILFIATIGFGGIALPHLSRARETANRIKCDNNLRQIGQSMLYYSLQNSTRPGAIPGSYPRTVYDPADPKVKFYTHPDAANPFSAGGPDPNDVTAAMFLLVRSKITEPVTFVCPSTNSEPLHDPRYTSNFPSAQFVSYSLHNPYPGDAATKDGFQWTATQRADFAIMADLNPGSQELTKLTATSAPEELEKGNSLNHSRSGQNVLYGDGHVDWVATPFAGVERDNIYTYGPCGPDKGGDGIIGPAATARDSVLLPTAAQGNPATQSATQPATQSAR